MVTLAPTPQDTPPPTVHSLFYGDRDDSTELESTCTCRINPYSTAIYHCNAIRHSFSMTNPYTRPPDTNDDQTHHQSQSQSQSHIESQSQLNTISTLLTQHCPELTRLTRDPPIRTTNRVSRVNARVNLRDPTSTGYHMKILPPSTERYPEQRFHRDRSGNSAPLAKSLPGWTDLRHPNEVNMRIAAL
jgi:hypothetical protein